MKSNMKSIANTLNESETVKPEQISVIVWFLYCSNIETFAEIQGPWQKTALTCSGFCCFWGWWPSARRCRKETQTILTVMFATQHSQFLHSFVFTALWNSLTESEGICQNSRTALFCFWEMQVARPIISSIRSWLFTFRSLGEANGLPASQRFCQDDPCQLVTACHSIREIHRNPFEVERYWRIPGYLNNAEGRKCVRWKTVECTRRSFDILSSLYISKLCSHKKLSCAVGAVCSSGWWGSAKRFPKLVRCDPADVRSIHPRSWGP